MEKTPRPAKPPRKPVLRWKGVLKDAPRQQRWLVFGMLSLVCLALSFSQFGFAGIGAPGEYSAYAVTLLLPVALCALLLGTGRGALMGLVAGSILFVHAICMPLNYYELEFVGPFVGFALFPLTGFLLGLMLALALRNEHGLVRRSIYITIATFLASGVFTALFTANVLVRAVFYILDNNLTSLDEGGALTDKVVGQMIFIVSRIGDVFLQATVDWLAMAAVCILALVLMGRLRAWHERKHSVNYVFNVWLAVAVGAVFLVVTTVSFVGITILEYADGSKDAAGELDYLSSQVPGREAISSKGGAVLDGYSADDDGVVLFSYPKDGGEDEIWLDNLPASRQAPGKARLLSDVLTADAISDIRKAAGDGSFARVIYDPSYAGYTAEGADGGLGGDGLFGGTQLRYVRSMMLSDGSMLAFLVPMDKVHAERPATMLFMTLSIFGVLLVVFSLTSQLLKRVVVRKIDEANEVLGKVTDGNLDARAPDQDTLEFDSLSRGINTTVVALDDMIREVEERNAKDLATAKAIQEDALPMDFPAFPDIDNFDIYASMKTAKEVGGDFYDFFEIGDAGRIGFVVADVSGKGIPAALFMMTAKTQIRSYMESGLPVEEAVAAANHRLCAGNEQGMFVTVLAGVLYYGTGHIDYVNAGHNPPAVCKKGKWEWLKDVSGLPLGLFDGMPYERREFRLGPGEQFYLYTDGVTEAMDVDGALFGEERLEETLGKYIGANPRTVCVGVRRALTDFTQDAEQSDDITMMGLKYGVPPEEKAIMVLDARRDQLVHVNNYIHAELHRRKAPKSVYNAVDIAAEELFVNVCLYAYPDATEEEPGKVRVMFEYENNPPSLTIQLADDGVPYNPLEKEDVNLDEATENLQIGGFGIWMAKQSVDEMTYERVDGTSNVLTFKKSW